MFHKLENTIEELREHFNKKIEKHRKKKHSISDLCDNIKCPNIRIMGIPEREESEKGLERIVEEIISQNFPNLG